MKNEKLERSEIIETDDGGNTPRLGSKKVMQGADKKM